MITRFFLLLGMFLLGYQLYAQDTLEAIMLANKLGSAIICDSLGRPFGAFDIIDNEYDSCLVAHATVRLFTRHDMVHIDKVQVFSIWKENDDGVCCERVSEDEEYYPVILAIIQSKIQEGLKGGFLVYPEHDIMSEHVSYALFRARCRINVFPNSPCYKENTSQCF